MAPTPPAEPAAPAPPIALADITGLVLAGGRGSRMGGIDKGLQSYHGMPLAMHAVLRLQRQVGSVMINANRNLAAYEAMGVPVWPDALADYPGPLAGMLAGLEHCETPWLLTVPCDTPEFPDDLAARLGAAAAAQGADIAMAATREDGVLRTQPVFCLINAMLMEDLMAWLQSGERKIDRWTARHRSATVEFSDPGAFFNANTPDELQRLQQRAQPPG
ncbi:MAG: molybdenum cofactor guanylyltransferase MobA [Rubrivivax sp.]|nr:molybdenum cofactor guanylyltransferase MobA [Rubrivivax sp.]